MERIINGFKQFHSTYYNENKELFKNLANGQKPHTLFIACSDSRVVPNVITSAKPGDIFVVRNIANIVPRYKTDIMGNSCTSSAIEYAVKKLNVSNIVICGHSDCGGCKAIYLKKEKLDALPFVKNWVINHLNIKSKVDSEGLNDKEKGEKTEKLNIIEQIKNIKTYPCVKEKLSNKAINILGCHYNIDSGKIEILNNATNRFEIIN